MTAGKCPWDGWVGGVRKGWGNWFVPSHCPKFLEFKFLKGLWPVSVLIQPILANILMVFSLQSKTTRQRQTNVESVHSCDALHTRSDKPGVKDIIEHLSCRCLVVVLLWSEHHQLYDRVQAPAFGELSFINGSLSI